MTRAIAFLLAFSYIQAPAPQPELSLLLKCGEQAKELILTIENPGQIDTAVLLGIAIGNGRWYLPRELVLDLRRNGRPEIEQLVYRGPVDVAGRIDHWVVPLPVRSRFELLLRANDFVSTAPTLGTAPPSEITVRLIGRQIIADLNVDMTGMKAWQLWTGRSSSNAVRLADCSA